MLIPNVRGRLRTDGEFFNTYTESFERVWASARTPDEQELSVG